MKNEEVNLVDCLIKLGQGLIVVLSVIGLCWLFLAFNP